MAGTPDTRAVVGAPYVFQPEASDADGDRLQFSAASLPAWVTLDPATGRLSGKPRPEDEGLHGPITLTVSDGVNKVALAAFEVRVEATGVPPPKGIIVSWHPAQGNADGTGIGEPMRYRIYVGRAPRDAETPALVKETAATLYQIRGLQPGTYYVALTTVTRDGVESEYSDELVARLN